MRRKGWSARLIWVLLSWVTLVNLFSVYIFLPKNIGGALKVQTIEEKRLSTTQLGALELVAGIRERLSCVPLLCAIGAPGNNVNAVPSCIIEQLPTPCGIVCSAHIFRPVLDINILVGVWNLLPIFRNKWKKGTPIPIFSHLRDGTDIVVGFHAIMLSLLPEWLIKMQPQVFVSE